MDWDGEMVGGAFLSVSEIKPKIINRIKQMNAYPNLANDFDILGASPF